MLGGPKVLFVGGTGIISAATARRCIEAGMDLTVLTRGRDLSRPRAPGARHLVADVNDEGAVNAALGSAEFDAVVDWVAFTAEAIDRDVRLFAGRTRQYVFISSASAYQTPPSSLPIRESTPLRNPFWQYSRDKIDCERRLEECYRTSGFPVTIIRPSHTYDETMVPFDGGWTVVDRMRRGAPVVVPGDGTSLWTITHSRDFAVGLVGLLGRAEAIGHAFHITSDDAIPWNRIYLDIAAAAGVEPVLVHVASATINRVDPVWGAALLGDKSHSMVFDNSKIKAFVPGFTCPTPFGQGAREIVGWHDADPGRRTVDPVVDATMDALVARYG